MVNEDHLSVIAYGMNNPSLFVFARASFNTASHRSNGSFGLVSPFRRLRFMGRNDYKHWLHCGADDMYGATLTRDTA